MASKSNGLLIYILFNRICNKTRKDNDGNKKKGENGKHTPIVAVGLKAILMLIISPFDIPPCNTSALILVVFYFYFGKITSTNRTGAHSLHGI
jgi:hypothetical protein